MAVDAAVIKATQESLGPFVKKPPLTEKLLGKPPFRFLHDVFSVIIRDTGTLSGINFQPCSALLPIAGMFSKPKPKIA